jgi:hypothetical protein
LRARFSNYRYRYLSPILRICIHFQFVVRFSYIVLCWFCIVAFPLAGVGRFEDKPPFPSSRGWSLIFHRSAKRKTTKETMKEQRQRVVSCTPSRSYLWSFTQDGSSLFSYHPQCQDHLLERYTHMKKRKQKNRIVTQNAHEHSAISVCVAVSICPTTAQPIESRPPLQRKSAVAFCPTGNWLLELNAC